jgi:hypothetical protein
MPLGTIYCLLFRLLSTYLHTMVDHIFVMNFVSFKFLLLFFWIKLLVKMANIRAIQKRYRPFTSTGFVSMLKPNVSMALITRDGARGAYYG